MTDEFTVQIKFTGEMTVEAESPEEAKNKFINLLKNERGKSKYIQPEELKPSSATIFSSDRGGMVKDYGACGFPAGSIKYGEKGFYFPLSVSDNQEKLPDE